MVGNELTDLEDLGNDAGGNGEMKTSKILDLVLSVTFVNFSLVFSTILWMDFNKR